MTTESNIEWSWATGWSASKYDDWTFYRKQFQRCADSATVDFVVLDDAGRTCWLLEVKDFTTEPPDRDKGELWQIVARKVRDTLAGLVAAARNGEGDERVFAERALAATTLRVAFHCERPTHKSRLFRGLPDPADLRDKLRRTLRAVDSKALVLECATTDDSVPWQATWRPLPAEAASVAVQLARRRSRKR